MRLHTLAAAVLAVSLSATVAAAADKGGPVAPPQHATGMVEPQLAGAHDGSYIGLLAGINANELKAEGLPSLSDTGHFGGAYIGYGVTVNGTYVGIELDAMLRDVGVRVMDGGSSISMSDRWMGSARLRIGQPIGPALLYGTGGLAVQQSTLSVVDIGLDEQAREYVFGLVLGAGIDLKMTNTLSIRLEGLHYAWQDEKFNIGGNEAKIGQADTVFRAGLAFRLN